MSGDDVYRPPGFDQELEDNEEVWTLRSHGNVAESSAWLSRQSAALEERRRAVDAARRSFEATFGDSAGASFGAGNAPASEREARELEHVFRRARDLLGRMLRVDSILEERWVASSHITVAGTIRTAARTDATVEEIDLHRSAVSCALATRVSHLELAGHVIAGAATVATAVSSPGGALLALPAVWRVLKRAGALPRPG